MKHISSVRKKIMFISPHAGIWPHALPESFLAKCLDPLLFDVSRIKCDGTFSSHCTVMEAHSLEIQEIQKLKDVICKQCKGNAEILRTSYAGKDFVISNYLSKEDEAEVERNFSALNKADIQKLTYHGVEVGKIAAYEVLIKFKKTSLNFNDMEFLYYETYIKNALLSLMAFIKIYNEEQPDILIAYSPQYAVLGVCARYFELKGKKIYFIEGSSNIEERYGALRIWDWTEFGLTNPALTYWDDFVSKTLLKLDYTRVEKHINRLLNASSFSVYSAPASGQFDMRKHFHIPPKVKVVLAAMSSYDEVYSAYYINRFPNTKYISNVFKDQLEWIKATINFFLEHPELFLIIRIHPRTFPSERNVVMAQEQMELAAILANLPNNVGVNLPTDKISIYDLYSQIDLLATGWSATGVEAMTFNVPVITYDQNLPSYPASIHYTGKSQKEYYNNLIKAVSVGKCVTTSDESRRWLAFSMSVGVVRHPTMLNNFKLVRGNSAINFLYRGFNRLFPSFIKRIEKSQKIQHEEARRVNALLKSNGKSLYDIPRISM
jgi:hypothetical protein